MKRRRPWALRAAAPPARSRPEAVPRCEPFGPPPSITRLARLSILTLGFLLVLLGLAGLVLPVLQGALTLLIGAAVLSVVSPTVDRFARRLLCRWPPVWRRLVRMRGWFVGKLESWNVS